MPLILTLLKTGATWLTRIGLAVVAVDVVARLTQDQKDSITEASRQAKAAGITEEDQKKLVAATTYDQVEQEGKEPDDFWAGLTPAEKEELQFSPQSLRTSMVRTKFLGIASALLWVGALGAGGFAAKRGIPILLSTLEKIRDARAGGATALQLMTIVEEGKIAGLASVWIPAFIAGIAGAGGWLTSSMANGLNDPLLWGRIFLGQAAADIEKATARLVAGTGQTGGGFAPSLTTTRTAKPKIFLGVVYAGRVADTPDFVRHIDDAITSDEDLKDDIEINLASWLATMADRLNYEIQVKFEPYDLDNVRKPGYWMTMALYYSGKGGKRIFIDEILLGPFDNKAYYPTTQITDSIRRAVDAAMIPDLLTPNFGSSGQLLITTKEGDKISVFPPTQTPAPATASPESAPVSTPAPTSVPARGQTGLTLEEESWLKSHGYGESVLRWGEIGSLERDKLTALVKASVAPAPAPSVSAPAPVSSPPVGVLAPSAPAPTFVSPFQQFFPSLPSNPFAPNAPVAPVLTTRQMRTNTGSVTLNLRSAPSLSASVVASLPNGTSLVVSTTEIVADGYTWVATVAPSRAGYVAKEFLLPA